jgi:hypothetical protein
MQGAGSGCWRYRYASQSLKFGFLMKKNSLNLCLLLWPIFYYYHQHHSACKGMSSRYRSLLETSKIWKHRYGKNPAVPVPGTSWVRILPGYRCMRTPGVPVFDQKKIFPVLFWYGSSRVGYRAKPKRHHFKPILISFSATRFSLLCSLSLRASLHRL